MRPRTKRCTICKAVLPLEDFNRKKASPDGHQTHCRACNRDACRLYYRRHRAKHLAEVKSKKKGHIVRNYEILLEHLLRHPCVDCGERDPTVLEFDHVHGAKERDLAAMATRPCSVKRIGSEIAKCEIRCVNCHRRRTGRTQKWWRAEHARIRPRARATVRIGAPGIEPESTA